MQHGPPNPPILLIFPPAQDKQTWRVAYWHPTADGPDQMPFVLVSGKRAYCEGFFDGIQDGGPTRKASGSYVLLVKPSGEVARRLDPVPLEPPRLVVPTLTPAKSPPYRAFGYESHDGGGNATSFEEAWESCMTDADGKPSDHWHNMRISHEEDIIAHVVRVKALGQIYYLNVPVKYDMFNSNTAQRQPILRRAEITAQDGKLCLVKHGRDDVEVVARGQAPRQRLAVWQVLWFRNGQSGTERVIFQGTEAEARTAQQLVLEAAKNKARLDLRKPFTPWHIFIARKMPGETEESHAAYVAKKHQEMAEALEIP